MPQSILKRFAATKYPKHNILCYFYQRDHEKRVPEAENIDRLSTRRLAQIRYPLCAISFKNVAENYASVPPLARRSSGCRSTMRVGGQALTNIRIALN